MSTKLRTAVIGCGSIAKTHSASLQKNADYAEIVAYVDVDEPRALALRDQYAPGAAVFTDWRVMLDEARPDVVHICTPHDLHCEMACECLGRGINVYLEKPICISEEELTRVEAAAAASKAKITVSCQNRRIACNRLFY
ncbi:MAG: Gfo/Idh/MocA family oxidoreductase, partial [Clostridia bacterium]|nr:Gfo/Idh/MocA family oxidoreductase [Clostridia bacterium]